MRDPAVYTAFVAIAVDVKFSTNLHNQWNLRDRCLISLRLATLTASFFSPSKYNNIVYHAALFALFSPAKRIDSMPNNLKPHRILYKF